MSERACIYKHYCPWKDKAEDWEYFWAWLKQNLPWVDIGDYDLEEFLEMKRSEFKENSE